MPRRREAGSNPEALAAHGMVEGNRVGVEPELPALEVLAKKPVVFAIAVDAVTHDRVAGAGEVPSLVVFNKCDLLAHDELARLTRGQFGKAEHFLEYGTFYFNTYKTNGKALAEAIVEQVVLQSGRVILETSIAEQAAEMFYRRLFELDPSLSRLFKGDMREQGRKLMSMIGAAVKGLDDLERLVPVVRKLGARHAGYGVKDRDYATVAQALLWTLEKGLGEAFTPDVREAWVAVYGVLADTMKRAAADTVSGVQPEAGRGSWLGNMSVTRKLMLLLGFTIAAVVGVADEHGLTKPKAYVVARPGQTLSETELKTFIKDRLAPYKYPRSTVFVAELPKTATGKIQRFKLREGVLG